MRSNLHKLLCLFLVLAILVSLSPAAAFADDGPQAQEEIGVPAEGKGAEPGEFPEADEESELGEDPDPGEEALSGNGSDTDDATDPDVFPGTIEDPDPDEEDRVGESPDADGEADTGEDPEGDGDTDTNEDPDADENADTDEDPDAEENADTDEDPDEGPDEALPVRLRFVSAQALRLTLTDAEGREIPPEEEAPAEEASEAEAAESGGDVPEEPAEVTADGASQDTAFEVVYLLVPGSYRYTAEAQGCCPVRDAALEVTEDMDGFTVTLALETEPLPCGFPGMPEGYVFSEEQLAARQALIDHDVVSVLESLTPGVDYAESELFFLADDEEYAQLVAEAYNADLESLDYRVAVIRLRDATVLEAVKAAADLTLPLPAVSANYLEEFIPVPEQRGGIAAQSADGLSREDWAWWRDTLGEDLDILLRDPASSQYQYMHEMINSYAAWGVTKGTDVTVAVLDSGVAAHEDLPGDIARVVVNADIDQGEAPTYNHGTHVAGIIAARLGNEGKGGAGVAPRANLLSIQVLNSAGRGKISDTVKGIYAAIEQNADIINMSLGGKYYDEYEAIAVRDAVSAGITLVTSMGNDGSNVMNYPGTFDIPGVIAVGAVTRGGNRAGYSNFGPWEDVAAPGSAIWSTAPGNSYIAKSGTSMAAPVVAGACALYMSYYGRTDPAEMERIIGSAVTNGVLDLSRLFARDVSAPSITVEGLARDTAPYGSMLSIEGRPGETIVYTLDGSVPTVKDGAVTNGVEYAGAFPLDSSSGVAVGKKITVRAIRVNGLGTASKVAVLSLTVDYAVPVEVVIREAPLSLVSGKSVTLKAEVLPKEARQTVTWEIRSREHAPRSAVNARSGLLTTHGADYGSVVVRAKSAAYNPTDGRSYCDYELTLKQALPTKTLRLRLEGQDVRTLTLNAGADSAVLSPAAFDRNGAEVEDVSFVWSSSNARIAEVSQDGSVRAIAKGKATIRCQVLDGSGVTASCTVTVRQLMTGLTLSLPDAAAPGSSVALSAAVSPSNADNKRILWSVDETSSEKGVAVKSGRLRIPGTLLPGDQITVTARSADGGAEVSVPVMIAPEVSRILLSVAPEPQFPAEHAEYSASGALKSLTLYTEETDSYNSAKTWSDTQVGLSFSFDVSSPAAVSWKSSNPRVALVDGDGLVTAVGAGSAKITATVNDGKGCRASLTVHVVSPASSVTVVSAAPALNTDLVDGRFHRLLGAGRSVRNKAVLGTAYGSPTVRKVTWGLEIEVDSPYADSGDALAEAILSRKLIRVNSSGTVIASAELKPYLSRGYRIYATVVASTTDFTGLEGRCTYLVTGQMKRITVRSSAWGSSSYNVSVEAVSDSWSAAYYNVTSNNPGIATAKMSGSTVMVYPNKEHLVREGPIRYASFTVTACDGSGRSMKVKLGFSMDSYGNVTVYDPLHS